MGFSVTATHIIFFVALLSAGSVAANSFWKTASELEEARRTFADRVDDRVHSNITIVGTPSWNNGAKRLTFVVQNTGSTVLDISDFVYLLDGVYSSSIESRTVGGASTTDILLPGEQLTVQMRPLAAQPSEIAVVTGNGVAAYWG